MKNTFKLFSILSVVCFGLLAAGCNGDPDADTRKEFDAKAAEQQAKALDEKLASGKKGGAGVADVTLDR